VNRKSLGCLFELLETLLVTAVIFLLLQMFVVQPYQVQQTSMENTLMPDQYVLVDKLSPNFDDYHRGDIIVFNPPEGWAKDANGTPFVKRIIGIAGDKVDIEAGKVYLNGKILDEPYVFEQQATDLPGTDTKKSWTIEKDQLFVMGDHRQASQDSRDFGSVSRSAVIGRAWIRYWPIEKFGPIPNKPAPSPGASPSAAASKTP
jgi:signal peptidase I